MLSALKYGKGHFLCIKVYEVNKNEAPNNHLCLNAKPVPQKAPDEAYLYRGKHNKVLLLQPTFQATLLQMPHKLRTSCL